MPSSNHGFRDGRDMCIRSRFDLCRELPARGYRSDLKGVANVRTTANINRPISCKARNSYWGGKTAKCQIRGAMSFNHLAGWRLLLKHYIRPKNLLPSVVRVSSCQTYSSTGKPHERQDHGVFSRAVNLPPF